MRRIFIIVGLFFLASMVVYGHLCNDVFEQAKDNLIVKVDVRDGQLRISDKGGFRVYLLNTMDRPIAKIHLEVETPDFDVQVKPSPGWQSYPQLQTVNSGGKKEYFEVELTRKKGTKEGKYKITLLLHGGDRRRVFKTMDVSDAMAVMEVPKKPTVLVVDGKVGGAEWQKALLCTSFYEYKKVKRYMENFPAAQQSRFRFYCDEENLYCLADFEKKSQEGKEDVAKIYIAKEQDSTPETVTINLQKGEVTCSASSEGIEAKKDEDGTKMEIKLPLALFGFKKEEEKKEEEKKEKEEKKRILFVNLSREHNGVVTYWRGNASSFKNPVTYATFILGKE
ncbi:MAG: hypothetical protein N2234_05370 [Planctomycetota bacterium]|nr:hypothetical protein [Planctomycetota bacterium]